MDYKKTLFQLLSSFPKELQNQRAEALGWFTIGDRSKDMILIKKGIQQQSKVIIDMLYFAGENENLLTTIGVIMSSHFLIGKYDFDEPLGSLLKKIDNLFVHELSLPAHHVGYSSQSELVKIILIDLGQVIQLIDDVPA